MIHQREVSVVCTTWTEEHWLTIRYIYFIQVVSIVATLSPAHSQMYNNNLVLYVSRIYFYCIKSILRNIWPWVTSKSRWDWCEILNLWICSLNFDIRSPITPVSVSTDLNDWIFPVSHRRIGRKFVRLIQMYCHPWRNRTWAKKLLYNERDYGAYRMMFIYSLYLLYHRREQSAGQVQWCIIYKCLWALYCLLR